ncbi:MAG: TnpA [Massilia sp.]|nr:TnpA [Massilia sp.]
MFGRASVALPLEATAQDDALEMLEALLRELFNTATKADNKARLRSLKDLDHAAGTLASACKIVLDAALPDAELRTRLFEQSHVSGPEMTSRAAIMMDAL